METLKTMSDLQLLKCASFEVMRRNEHEQKYLENGCSIAALRTRTYTAQIEELNSRIIELENSKGELK
jgi:hypothetical protein